MKPFDVMYVIYKLKTADGKKIQHTEVLSKNEAVRLMLMKFAGITKVDYKIKIA